MEFLNNRFAWVVVAVGMLVSILATGNVEFNTKKAAEQMGAKGVTQVSFSRGSPDLSETSKSELQQLIDEAKRKGSLQEVKVAAWGDEETPQETSSLSNLDVNLARRRAENIQTFLKNNIGIGTVSTINMAVRSNGIQNALNNPNSQAINDMDRNAPLPAAPAPSRSDDTGEQTGIYGLKDKASEAVILIYLK